MAEDVVVTAWDVTMMRDCNLVIEDFVLSSLASSSPLYSWLWSCDNFFSCSIFTPSLAWKQKKNQHLPIINQLVSKIHQKLKNQQGLDLDLDFFIQLLLPCQETVKSGTEALHTVWLIQCRRVYPVLDCQWRLRAPCRAQVAEYATRMNHSF